VAVSTMWTGRVAQAAAKYGEHAPMATACCNVCRTCTTTNAIGLAGGGVLAAAYAVKRFADRFTKPAV
jgi:hypothetical protein